MPNQQKKVELNNIHKLEIKSYDYLLLMIEDLGLEIV